MCECCQLPLMLKRYFILKEFRRVFQGAVLQILQRFCADGKVLTQSFKCVCVLKCQLQGKGHDILQTCWVCEHSTQNWLELDDALKRYGSALG